MCEYVLCARHQERRCADKGKHSLEMIALSPDSNCKIHHYLCCFFSFHQKLEVVKLRNLCCEQCHFSSKVTYGSVGIIFCHPVILFGSCD